MVRVEADGNALVAGKAEPGSTVTIYMDGSKLDSVTADRSGKFVAFLTLGTSETPRVLSLEMTAGDQVIASADQVILAPVVQPTPPVQVAQAPAETVAETETSTVAALDTTAEETPGTPADKQADKQIAKQATEQGTEPAASEVVTATPEAQETPETPAPTVTTQVADKTGRANVGDAPEVAAKTDPTATTVTTASLTEPATPAAPSVLLANRDGVRVLQPALSNVSPEVMSTVALDTISYTDDGDVSLAGRASQGDRVRIYLDNTPITDSRITQDGSWQVGLPQVDTGVYTLRIDEVNTEGTVTSRVETPFKREDPKVLAAVQKSVRENAQPVAQNTAQAATSGTPAPTANAPKPAIQAITVQAGSTLWAIAREQYGEGTMYVRVFEANKDRIRNPDLIYPGQVFEMPANQ